MAGISRAALHELLWERRYDGDLVTVNQIELADQLAITKHYMNRVMRKMSEEGRVESVGDQIYRVVDPATLDIC